jgi:predicted porin
MTFGEKYPMKKTALTLAALCLALTAQAQNSATASDQPHTYGLLSLGQGRLNADCSGVQACDRNATGGKAIVGYAFGNGFSLEGGYSHFGKFRASDGVAGLSARPEAVSLTGAFTANLTPDLGLVGRAGVARVRTRVSAEVGSLTGAGSESHTQPIVGLGLNYALTPTTRVELGVDATRAEVQGERANVRLVTVGARMAF